MKRIGWTTDIHLSVCDEATRHRFYQEIRDANLDQLWLGGDIGEAVAVVAKQLVGREVVREVEIGVAVAIVVGPGCLIGVAEDPQLGHVGWREAVPAEISQK